MHLNIRTKITNSYLKGNRNGNKIFILIPLPHIPNTLSKYLKNKTSAKLYSRKFNFEVFMTENAKKRDKSHVENYFL